MRKEIKVKEDPKTGDCYLDIKDFSDVVDITKVDKYKFSDAKDGSLVITFYDKDGNVVYPKK